MSVSAITNIKDKIYLCNGEAIDFTVRRRKAVRLEWREKQKLMIDEINGQNPPRTDEEYHKYYEICDKFPFAFTDIEMVFNEKRHAVDWNLSVPDRLMRMEIRNLNLPTHPITRSLLMWL